MTAAIKIMYKFENCIKHATDIIMLSIANCMLTPKIIVGRVRPTNKGSDANFPLIIPIHG